MARRRILKDMGYNFSIVTADIDEKATRKDKPEELVIALAEAKTLLYRDWIALILLRVVAREKPSGKEEAREFMKGYSGSHAAAVGSVLVMNLYTGTRRVSWDSTEVLIALL
ncbi:hypothetical protein MLD38_004663 [Melastoma candidum]|uniref:Uncharacterized protein n=1 Tax=Melastoma candidum TaxID=119954 RepID=A0ACB9S636_9MYRT|nr:hypothetical protein MLD38_004663 [Melastoma candidum]